MSNTPILDHLAPVPAARPRWSGSELPFLQVYLVFALVGLEFYLNSRLCHAGVAESAAWLVAGWFICLTLHECGHFFAGRLLGYNWLCVLIGPLAFTSAGGHKRVGFNAAAGFLDGRVLTLPSRPGVPVWHELSIVAAGPLCGVLPALLIAATWRREPEFAHAYELPVIFMAAVQLLISLIPWEPSGIPSDGARLLALARGEGPAACARLDLLGRKLRKEPPRKWDEVVVRRAAAPVGTLNARCTGNMLAYAWAMDRGDAILAFSFIESALACSESADRATRHFLFRQAAFVQWRLRFRSASAARWLRFAELELHGPGINDSSRAVLLSIEDRLGKPSAPRFGREA